MNSLDVEFIVDDDDDLALLTAALEDEQAADVERVSDTGFVPVVGIMIAAVIAVTGLANVVVKLARSRKRGVVVDARGPIIRTQVSNDLPSGTVLVIAPDDVRHEFHDLSSFDLTQVLRPSST